MYKSMFHSRCNLGSFCKRHIEAGGKGWMLGAKGLHCQSVYMFFAKNTVGPCLFP